MVGKLVHYNCASSNEIAIVTRAFTYEGPQIGSLLKKGEMIIAVSWVRGINRLTPRPASVNPGLLASRLIGMSMPGNAINDVIHLGSVSDTIAKQFPEDWPNDRWYLSGWFKEISSN
jgi:hypothetical protein